MRNARFSSVVSLFILMFAAAPVFAATLVVSNTNDSGAGSLRDQIAAATAGDIINLGGVSGTITLTSGVIAFNKALTINGPGARVLTISGNSSSQIFESVNPVGSIIINDIAFVLSSGSGGAVDIFGGGPHLISGCEFNSTQSSAAGKALTLAFNTATILNTTVGSFSGTNVSSGGIGLQDGTYTLQNVTISNGGTASYGLSAFTSGSGITVNMTNVTINNCQNGGVTAGVQFSNTATINYRNCIFANNGGTNFSTGITDGTINFNSLGNNLSDDGTGLSQITDINANPLLGGFGNWGGPTNIIPLLPGSPAINAGTATGAPTADQRGVARVGTTDIGAFESRGFTMAITGGNSQTVPISNSFSSALTVSVISGFVEPVDGGVVTFTPPGAGASCTAGTVTIVSGTPDITSGSASFTPTANAITGGPYTVAASATGATTQNFSVTNDSTTISIDDVTLTEGNAGTTTFTFTVSLSKNAFAGGVSFNIATANGTATTADGDYVASSLSSQTIAAGSNSYTFNVTVNGDTKLETNQTFFVNLTSVSRAVVGDSQGLGTINNDDTAPVVSIGSPAAATEGTGAGTTTLTFPVSLSNLSDSDVTVAFNAEDGTATSADYSVTTATPLTISAGQGSGNINVDIVRDVLDEVNETFTITLSSPTNATLDTNNVTGTGTINNDDTAPEASIDSQTVVEGTSGIATALTFTVSLSAVSGQTVTVPFTVADGTAVAADYSVTTASPLVFAAGETSKTISVDVTADSIDESDEQFTVTLGTPTNASLGTASVGTATVTDDDASPVIGSFNVTASTLRVDEPVTFNVSATGTGGLTITYDYGDSTSDATGVHSYTVPGTYTAKVSVSDGVNVTTQEVQITVVTPSLFANLTLTKLQIKLNFAKTDSDSISFSGLLPVPAGFVVNGQQVVLNVGGVTKTLGLDAKGKSPKGNDAFSIKIKAKKGVVLAQDAKFSAKFNKGNFDASLADENLVGTADVKGVSRDVQVSVTFNTTIYRKTQPQLYSAKTGKTGSTKQPKL